MINTTVAKPIAIAAPDIAGYIQRVHPGNVVVYSTTRDGVELCEVANPPLWRVTIDGEHSPVAPLRSFGRDITEAGQWPIGTGVTMPQLAAIREQLDALAGISDAHKRWRFDPSTGSVSDARG